MSSSGDSETKEDRIQKIKQLESKYGIGTIFFFFHVVVQKLTKEGHYRKCIFYENLVFNYHYARQMGDYEKAKSIIEKLNNICVESVYIVNRKF